jgi:hypothetical protein
VVDDTVAHWSGFEAEKEKHAGAMRLLGRGRASGVEVEALGAAVWTLRDGTVTGLTLYQTRNEALRAVGSGGRRCRSSHDAPGRHPLFGSHR